MRFLPLYYFFLLLSLFSLEGFEKKDYCASRYSIGADILYRSYSEKLEAPLKSEEEGFLYGIQLSYDKIIPRKLYFGVEGRIAKGNVAYDGSLLNINTGELTPYKDTTDSVIYNVENRLGYTFCINPEKHFLLIPFIGIGVHSWYRANVDNLPGDYSEIYFWRYAALGLRSEWEVHDCLEIGVNVKLIYPFYARMKTSFLTSKFHLGNKLQYEVELPMTFYPSCSLWFIDGLRFSPYWRSQPIGMSNIIQNSWFEPASSTHVFGARIECIIYL